MIPTAWGNYPARNTPRRASARRLRLAATLLGVLALALAWGGAMSPDRREWLGLAAVGAILSLGLAIRALLRSLPPRSIRMRMPARLGSTSWANRHDSI